MGQLVLVGSHETLEVAVDELEDEMQLAVLASQGDLFERHDIRVVRQLLQRGNLADGRASNALTLRVELDTFDGDSFLRHPIGCLEDISV